MLRLYMFLNDREETSLRYSVLKEEIRPVNGSYRVLEYARLKHLTIYLQFNYLPAFLLFTCSLSHYLQFIALSAALSFYTQFALYIQLISLPAVYFFTCSLSLYTQFMFNEIVCKLFVVVLFMNVVLNLSSIID